MPSFDSSKYRSNPLISGICTSAIRHAVWPTCGEDRNSFADENVSAVNPNDRIRRLMDSRTCSSSSTIAISRRLVRTSSTLPERFSGTTDLPFTTDISRYTTLGGKCSPCDLYEAVKQLYQGVVDPVVWHPDQLSLHQKEVFGPPGSMELAPPSQFLSNPFACLGGGFRPRKITLQSMLSMPCMGRYREAAMQPGSKRDRHRR